MPSSFNHASLDTGFEYFSSSRSNELSSRLTESRRPHNYCRIWESPPRNITLIQNVCHWSSKLSQQDGDSREGESLGTVPQTLFSSQETNIHSDAPSSPLSPSSPSTKTRPAHACATATRSIDYAEFSSEDSSEDEYSQPSPHRTLQAIDEEEHTYECEVCYRTFTHVTQLQRHTASCGYITKVGNRAKYGVDEVKCSRCSFSNESPEAVIIHYVNVHDGHSKLAETKAKTKTKTYGPPQRHPPIDMEGESKLQKSSSSSYDASSDITNEDIDCFSPSSRTTSSDRLVNTNNTKAADARSPSPLRPIIKHYYPSSRRRPDYQQYPVVECDGVLRYVCEVCNFTLNRPSDLARHRRSNKHRAACGKPPYQFGCERCGQGFSRADALKRHITKICH